MGDMDPCECVWNHERAMQRLMNLLRNSQTACTDTECLTGGPSPGDPSAAGGFSTLMLIMFGWLIVATALFLLRPATLRRNAANEKPATNNGGGGGRHDPPVPPIH